MNLHPALSHIFYGIQLGAIDAIILLCIITVTTDIADKDGRMFSRLLLFAALIFSQVVAGAISVDKGGEFWGPVLEVGYVVLGTMMGALGVYKGWGEVGRWMATKERKKKENVRGEWLKVSSEKKS